MNKIINHLKDRFLKGLVFLLPLLVVIILIGKAMAYMKGFSTKIAGLFGVPKIMGVASHTIVSTLLIIAICILLGYMVQFRFLANFRNWLDAKLESLLPGYATYREMALRKINKEEEKLPYDKAVLVRENNYHIPGFLMDILADGRLTIFVPVGGNPKEGSIIIVSAGDVTILETSDVKKMHISIQKMGMGMRHILT